MGEQRFKVGDRVTNNDTTRVDVTEHWNTYFRRSQGEIIDGALVVASVSDRANVSNIGLSNKVGRPLFYMPESTLKFAEPATLKIEAGKLYKTRDGRKVGPSYRYSDGWSMRSEGGNMWLSDGKRYFGGQEESEIIAEWIEEPVAAINDNAEPKFKVGDRVRLARSFSGVAKVGATATVDKRGMFDGYIDIVWDKNSLHQGQMDGGYSPDYFELLPPAPSAHTTIVALIENGQPKPSSTPHVHTSTGAAEQEAKRLAAKFKGKQFGVFTLTTTHEKAAPVYDHKWQNLAVLGLKIDAIKELRSITGMGLKPAKDAVEYFLDAA